MRIGLVMILKHAGHTVYMVYEFDLAAYVTFCLPTLYERERRRSNFGQEDFEPLTESIILFCSGLYTT